jgi:hypothetical protein
MPRGRHAASRHHVQHLAAQRVVADAGKQHRREPESRQMPGNVERRAAEDRAVGKDVSQDFAESYLGSWLR